MPPKWDVNLFKVRAVGRGVYDDVAAQGLFPGSASVCLCVKHTVFVCPGCVGGWSGFEFQGNDGANDSGERDLQKVKEK